MRHTEKRHTEKTRRGNRAPTRSYSATHAQPHRHAQPQQRAPGPRSMWRAAKKGLQDSDERRSAAAAPQDAVRDAVVGGREGGGPSSMRGCG